MTSNPYWSTSRTGQLIETGVLPSMQLSESRNQIVSTWIIIDSVLIIPGSADCWRQPVTTHYKQANTIGWYRKSWLIPLFASVSPWTSRDQKVNGHWMAINIMPSIADQHNIYMTINLSSSLCPSFLRRLEDTITTHEHPSMTDWRGWANEEDPTNDRSTVQKLIGCECEHTSEVSLVNYPISASPAPTPPATWSFSPAVIAAWSIAGTTRASSRISVYPVVERSSVPARRSSSLPAFCFLVRGRL